MQLAAWGGTQHGTTRALGATEWRGAARLGSITKTGSKALCATVAERGRRRAARCL